ncbi:hypothetical protein PO909_020496 [Leuciscus waleckii]
MFIWKMVDALRFGPRTTRAQRLFYFCPAGSQLFSRRCVCADSASHHVLYPGSAPASLHMMPRRQMALRLPKRASSIPSSGICRQPGLTLSKDKDAETALSFMFFVSPLFPGGRDKQLFVGTLAPPMCAVRCCVQEVERWAQFKSKMYKSQLVITGGFLSDIFMYYSEAKYLNNSRVWQAVLA